MHPQSTHILLHTELYWNNEHCISYYVWFDVRGFENITNLFTFMWLQILREEADKASSTGWVISKIVWNKDAATINKMMDIAPNLWGNFMSIRPVCMDKRNITIPSVIPIGSRIILKSINSTYSHGKMLMFVCHSIK